MKGKDPNRDHHRHRLAAALPLASLKALRPKRTNSGHLQRTACANAGAPSNALPGLGQVRYQDKRRRLLRVKGAPGTEPIGATAVLQIPLPESAKAAPWPGSGGQAARTGDHSARH